MRRLGLISSLVFLAGFISLLSQAEDGISTIKKDDGVIRVGVDCDARSKSIHIVTALFNANDKDNIYLLSSNLSLGENIPHAYSFVPEEDVQKKDFYKYTAPYVRQIEVESASDFLSQARFILPPGEEVVVRDPVSRFYILDFKKKYHVTSYFGFLSKHNTHMFSSKLTYSIDPTCFEHDGILWLDDARVETTVLHVPDS